MAFGFRRFSGVQHIVPAAAGLGWAALVIGASVAVLHRPGRSIFDVYRDAAEHFWAAEPLYGAGMRAFVYFPSAALVFSPFAALGSPWDDLAWRVASVLVFVVGLRRLVQATGTVGAGRRLAVILLLALPCAGVDVQRGQASVAMAGLIFLGAADAGGSRWLRAAVWLALAVALKPLALVAAALFGAVFAGLRWPLLMALAAVSAAPFIHPDPMYIVGQYAAMAHTLGHAADLGVTRFNDVAMMLNRFGIDVPERSMLVVRMLCGLATLALARAAERRQARPEAARTVVALCVCYILLFNPRTELGNYLALAAIAGLAVTAPAPVGQPERIATAVLILALGTQAYGDWIYRPTDVWLKPLLCCLFASGLAIRVMREPAFAVAARGMPASTMGRAAR